MKLRTQISLNLIACSLFSCLLISVGLLALEQRSLKTQSEREARLLLSGGLRVAEQALLTEDILLVGSYLESLQRSHPEILGIRIQRNGGRWLQSGGSTHRDKSRPPWIIRGTAKIPGNKEVLQLEFRFSRDYLEKQAKTLLADAMRRIVWLTGIAGLVSLAFALLLAQRLIQPIMAVIGLSKELAQGRPIPRLSIRSGWANELGDLIGHINDMAARLRELDQMKRDFVTSTTHELRSPLSAIEISARMLLREKSSLPDEEKTEMLQHIQKNAEALESLVTNLLEMAHIERGTMEFAPRLTDLASVVRDTVTFMQPEAAEKNKNIVIELSGQSHRVIADSQRLHQVLINLISNALKYAPSGKKVIVYVLRQPEGIECGVKDQGPGIPSKDKERIFRPFERAESTGEVKGTGIGLALCKTLIEMQGGMIDVESAPGEGSRFYFVLPEAQPS